MYYYENDDILYCVIDKVFIPEGVAYIQSDYQPKCAEDEYLKIDWNLKSLVKSKSIKMINTAKTPSELTEATKLISNQISMANERSDFLEDIVAEMAVLLYEQ